MRHVTILEVMGRDPPWIRYGLWPMILTWFPRGMRQLNLCLCFVRRAEEGGDDRYRLGDHLVTITAHDKTKGDDDDTLTKVAIGNAVRDWFEQLTNLVRGYGASIRVLLLNLYSSRRVPQDRLKALGKMVENECERLWISLPQLGILCLDSHFVDPRSWVRSGYHPRIRTAWDQFLL